MPPGKILPDRCVEQGAFFLVDVSLTFPRFPRISKNRLNTSLEFSLI